MLGQVSIRNQTTHRRKFCTPFKGLPKPTRYAQADNGEAEFKVNSLYSSLKLLTPGRCLLFSIFKM